MEVHQVSPDGKLLFLFSGQTQFPHQPRPLKFGKSHPPLLSVASSSRWKNIQSDILDSIIEKNFHHAVSIGYPFPMAQQPGQATLLGPPAIAVHAKGDVLRKDILSPPIHSTTMTIPDIIIKRLAPS